MGRTCQLMGALGADSLQSCTVPLSPRAAQRGASSLLTACLSTATLLDVSGPEITIEALVTPGLGSLICGWEEAETMQRCRKRCTSCDKAAGTGVTLFLKSRNRPLGFGMEMS